MDTKWQEQASCLGLDWFVEDGKLHEKRGICKECPVKAECLDFALGQKDESPVVYGGLTGNQRAKVLA